MGDRVMISNILSKKGILDYIYYVLGGQRYNYYVCGTYGKPEERNFTKWKTYLDSVAVTDQVNHIERWEDRKYFDSINQRQILPNEIVLDLEEPERIKEIVDKLRNWEWDFKVFETGSRGYHIHIQTKEDFTVEEKEAIVKNFDTDIQKCSEKNLIALEYCPHWKTGKLKQEVEIL